MPGELTGVDGTEDMDTCVCVLHIIAANPMNVHTGLLPGEGDDHAGEVSAKIIITSETRLKMEESKVSPT